MGSTPLLDAWHWMPWRCGDHLIFVPKYCLAAVAALLLGTVAAGRVYGEQAKSGDAQHTGKPARAVQDQPVVLGREVEREIKRLPRDRDLESPQVRDLLSRIERGDRQGMAIYLRLHPTADGGWGESLDYSVAVALLRHPENVLALADTSEKLDGFVLRLISSRRLA